MAEAALYDLPDTIDREAVAAWGGKWGHRHGLHHRPDGRQPI